MLVKNFQHLNRPNTTGDVSGQTELRIVIRSGQHRGQRVRLMSAQSSIGSSMGCTLRAALPGVAPIHCWIQNSGRLTSLQANGYEVILNGRGVTHAILQPGDNLRLGTLELQIAECPHELTAAPLPELSLGAGAAIEMVDNLSHLVEEERHLEDAPTPVREPGLESRPTRDLQALRNERRLGHRRLKRALLRLREIQSRLQSLTYREQDLIAANRSLASLQSSERESLLAQIADHQTHGIKLSQQLVDAENQLRLEQAKGATLLEQLQKTQAALTEAQGKAESLDRDVFADQQALIQANQKAEEAHLEHVTYVKHAEHTLENTKKELAHHLAESLRLQSALIEQETRAKSLEEQVAILEKQLVDLQSAAPLSLATKSADQEELRQQLEAERKQHEQEAAEFTAVRARLERELTCLAATVREFQAERIAAIETSSACTEEERVAQEMAREELALLHHKRQAEQEEWTRVRTRFEQERLALQAQVQQYENERQNLHGSALEVQKQVQQLQDALSEKDWSIESLTQKHADAMQQLAIQQTHAQLEQAGRSEQAFQLQAVQQEREALAEQVTTLQESLSKLQAELGLKDASLAETQAQLNQLIEELNTSGFEKSNTIQTLQLDLETLRQYVSEKEATWNDRSSLEQIERLQKELEEQRQSAEEARLSSTALQEEHAATVQLVKELQTQLSEQQPLPTNHAASDELLAVVAQRDQQYAQLQLEQESLCEQLLVAEQKVQELSEKLAAQEAALATAQAEQSQAVSTSAEVEKQWESKWAELQSQLAEITSERNLLLENSQSQSDLTLELDHTRQLLAECQLEKNRLHDERYELQHELKRLQEDLQARPASEAVLPECSSPADVVEDHGNRSDEARMAASAEDIRMSFSPFNWQAERERIMSAAREEASSYQEEAPQQVAHEPTQASYQEPQASYEPSTPSEAPGDGGVDSVLSRLMKAGVWKADESSSAESIPAASNFGTSRDGLVTERFRPEEYQRASESQEAEVTDEATPIAEEPVAKSADEEAYEAQLNDLRSSYHMPPPSGSYYKNEETRQTSMTPQSTSYSPPASATSPQASEEGDESIESYMERLLNRVRGEAGTAPTTDSGKITNPRMTQVTPEPEQNIRMTTTTADLVDHSEYVPRSQAPEQVHQLSALRELANTAARSAIEHHAKKNQRLTSANTNVAAMGLAAGGLALGAVAAYTGMWQVWVAAGSAVGGSALMGGKFLKDALGAAQKPKPAESHEPTAEVSEEPDSVTDAEK